jgi:hypothetical protein
MTYTLISQNKKDAGSILGFVRAWDGVVREAWLPWMVGRPIKDIVTWCRQYHISWRVDL